MQSEPPTIAARQSPECSFRSASVLGVRIHDVSAKDIVLFITETCLHHEKAIVSNANVHAMNIAGEQAWFRDFLNRSQLVFCDGFGVSLASALLGQGWLRRNTPPDWINMLVAEAVEKDLSLYFLGTRQEIVEKAADVFRSRFPALRIVGCHHGYFDKARTSPENTRVLEEINHLQPDILAVGFGMPLQEQWIQENWEHLDVNVALPIGAMFDFVAGQTYRAPRWITDRGLEWLSRLLVEPHRLWRRYAVGLPVFFWHVIREKIGRLQLT